jgi:hypothetical protein
MSVYFGHDLKQKFMQTARIDNSIFNLVQTLGHLNGMH